MKAFIEKIKADFQIPYFNLRMHPVTLNRLMSEAFSYRTYCGEAIMHHDPRNSEVICYFPDPTMLPDSVRMEFDDDKFFTWFRTGEGRWIRVDHIFGV